MVCEIVVPKAYYTFSQCNSIRMSKFLSPLNARDRSKLRFGLLKSNKSYKRNNKLGQNRLLQSVKMY